jgi:hypothetical protein
MFKGITILMLNGAGGIIGNLLASWIMESPRYKLLEPHFVTSTKLAGGILGFLAVSLLLIILEGGTTFPGSWAFAGGGRDLPLSTSITVSAKPSVQKFSSKGSGSL